MYMSKKIIGDVMLKRLYLRKLPEILRDLIIDGKFSCSDNNLLSLENSPLKVTDAFYCNYNKLITLKGCTQFVGGFACNETNITSLEGCPQDVITFFNCNNNRLTSLVGAPKRIYGYFECGENNLTSLIGAPEYVGGNFNCGQNKLTSLEGCPKYVGGDFFCRNNGVQFSEKQIRAVCDVKGSIFSVDVLYNRE